jgi:hypothetical protein
MSVKKALYDVNISWDATSRIYHQCIQELGYSRQSISLQLEEGDLSRDEYIKLRQNIDDLYLKRVLDLPSDVLELILKTHNNGINRTQRTIDAVQLELLTRSIEQDEKR